nr:periplasmic heavy metal sensor [Nitrospira sp.]
LLKHEKEIGLTEEQIKKLKAIELDYDRMHIKAEADIHVAERELRALAEDEKTELSAIEAKVTVMRPDHIWEITPFTFVVISRSSACI